MKRGRAGTFFALAAASCVAEVESGVGLQTPVPLSPDGPPPAVDGRSGARDALTPPEPDAGWGPDAPADRGAPCPQTAFLCNPVQKTLPRTMAELGLYPKAGSFDVVGPNVHTFVPRHELWSDGLAKRRHVVLPAGGRIDISHRDAWVFPIGTAFFKTFFSDGPSGPKPVETRVIRRTDDPDPFEQYEFDVYKWNEAGTEATWLDITSATPVPVTLAGKSHVHQIPSRDDCSKCHVANDTVVIGFDEVRLNFALAPGGNTQLALFAASGFFNQPPPSPAAEIKDANPLTQKIKAYAYGNCFHCHNGSSPQVFDMGFAQRPDTFVATLVGKRTEGSGTATGIRVVPKSPTTSVLYQQMTRVNLPMGRNPMPPLGVQIAHAEALQMVHQWILSLP